MKTVFDNNRPLVQPVDLVNKDDINESDGSCAIISVLMILQELIFKKIEHVSVTFIVDYTINSLLFNMLQILICFFVTIRD